MASIENQKEYAVLSTVNKNKHDDAEHTNNLIHQSGRLQLNTYQSFVSNFMNPRSDMKSLLLVHMTGTGKTISALATATEYVRQYKFAVESLTSIVVLGFTQNIFKKEILKHPEFLFVSFDESNKLNELEQEIHKSTALFDQYQSMKKRYHRRLTRRNVKGIYKFYGYKQFANRVIDMEDVQNMIKKTYKDATAKIAPDDFNPHIIKQWIDNGDVKINYNFIKELARSLFICDEIHNVYSKGEFNTYGLAIHIVLNYYHNQLDTNDIHYGAVRTLLLSATPLTTSALEIIPLIKLLTNEDIDTAKIFKLKDGAYQLTSLGASMVKNAISGKISYIMDDNPDEYPLSNFVGETVKTIQYLKFVKTKPVDHQLNCYNLWTERGNAVDERGSNMIKDIVFPSIKEYPNGVYFSRNISDLDTLPAHTAVHRSADGLLTSNIFKLPTLQKYSSKYAKVVQMCLQMKGREYGKIFIFHPFVQGSGTEMIISILNANGLILEGDAPTPSSICMKCNILHSKHKSSDHEFCPVVFTYITGSLSKQSLANRISLFNGEDNTYGERLKIIIGSRAMKESHTLKACRHVIIAHEPSSISEMVQIIGRAVRKQSHALLPVDMKTVDIYIITTDVSSISHMAHNLAVNEEEAYRSKVLQYMQINRIEKIMYDVSIDYLINFRFKTRETPPLLGESYTLEIKSQLHYEKTLTSTYSAMRKGVAQHGIHTNRFNLFYLENEMKLVIIIIKRILLDHQPMITVKQLYSTIREPPFYVEYNTKLISDQSIAVAIDKIVFQRNQLRTISVNSDQSIVDVLFDISPIIIDYNKIRYYIVSIGDPLCADSYLTKRTVSSIISNETSTIDIFKQARLLKKIETVDLLELSATWADAIDINEVLSEISAYYIISDFNSIINTLNRIPTASHVILVEWLIRYAGEFALYKKIQQDINLNVIIHLLDYYNQKRLIFSVNDLQYTKIYKSYKQYNTKSGSTWYSTNAKRSTSSLPIGHNILANTRIFQPHDKSWIELKTIGEGVQLKHPYKFYIYEERDYNTLDVIIKVKFQDDISGKNGITMKFLQVEELDNINKVLKIKTQDKKPPKNTMIQKIEQVANVIQNNIYPKRIIYKLIDL